MTGSTVVITGASGGVGRALARVYGARGDPVALLARGEAGLAGAARDVEDAGGRPLPIVVDVADAEQVEAAAARIEAELGPVDVWINNAMVTVMARTWDTTPEEFRRVIEIDYLGYVNGTLAALRRMRPRDAGTIVQVGSALAFRGIPLQGAYCASKHAIVGFTETLHAELLSEHSSIDVCDVHLPGVNTTQFTWGRNKLPNKPQPVAPIFQPEVAADAIAWAADHGRRLTYVGASTVLTVWGNRLAQPLIARYLARTNIDAQQRDEPADPHAPDNLFEPQDGQHDHGAHGPFDDRARAWSAAQVISTRRRHDRCRRGARGRRRLARLAGPTGASRLVRRGLRRPSGASASTTPPRPPVPGTVPVLMDGFTPHRRDRTAHPGSSDRPRRIDPERGETAWACSDNWHRGSAAAAAVPPPPARGPEVAAAARAAA
jgi:NAD(P)-dependent dehydrogenase (short-subunit alcohol dehydrogenase family)